MHRIPAVELRTSCKQIKIQEVKRGYRKFPEVPGIQGDLYGETSDTVCTLRGNRSGKYKPRASRVEVIAEARNPDHHCGGSDHTRNAYGETPQAQGVAHLKVQGDRVKQQFKGIAVGAHASVPQEPAACGEVQGVFAARFKDEVLGDAEEKALDYSGGVCD